MFTTSGVEKKNCSCPITPSTAPVSWIHIVGNTGAGSNVAVTDFAPSTVTRQAPEPVHATSTNR